MTPKEIVMEFVTLYREDRKEFWETILGFTMMTGLFLLIIFFLIPVFG